MSMSTRSQIQFVHSEDDWRETVQIYRHSDGYPGGVVPALERLCRVQSTTHTHRGPSHTAANFIFLCKLEGMRFYVGDGGSRDSIHRNDVLEPTAWADELSQPFFLMGYGVEQVGDIHGDEEYLYVVDVAGDEWTVKVSEHAAFPTEDAFENAEWAYEAPLPEAVEWAEAQ
jgi:hypothetical protein